MPAGHNGYTYAEVATRLDTGLPTISHVLSPADAKLTALDFSTLDKEEFRSGWRLDVEGSGDEFVVELTDDAH